jgi:hypothetical protein
VPREEKVSQQKTAFGKKGGIPDAGDNSAPAPEQKAEKRGVLSRVFGNNTTPQYAWDGQTSSLTLKAPVSQVFGRTVETLRGLGFVINTEETRRQETTGKIQAAKADKTTALITVEEKQPGTTDIKIKVGQTGDRDGSERILDEIQKTKTPAKKPAAPAATDKPASKEPAK